MLNIIEEVSKLIMHLDIGKVHSIEERLRFLAQKRLERKLKAVAHSVASTS